MSYINLKFYGQSKSSKCSTYKEKNANVYSKENKILFDANRNSCFCNVYHLRNMD